MDREGIQEDTNVSAVIFLLPQYLVCYEWTMVPWFMNQTNEQKRNNHAGGSCTLYFG